MTPLRPPTGSEGSPDLPDELVTDVFARNCPSRRTMEAVGSKWGILALVALAESPYRFNALRRRVDGVSEKMLSQTLHTLERDGMVLRDVQGTIPPRVEYTLTPLGQRIAVTLRDLIGLVESSMPEIVTAQQSYDAAPGTEGSGQGLAPVPPSTATVGDR